MIKRGNQAVTEALVTWRKSFPEDATWETLSTFQTQIPDFLLEDKDALKGKAVNT